MAAALETRATAEGDVELRLASVALVATNATLRPMGPAGRSAQLGTSHLKGTNGPSRPARSRQK
jgi:hypothetical protein